MLQLYLPREVVTKNGSAEKTVTDLESIFRQKSSKFSKKKGKKADLLQKLGKILV